jgi:hypothetical protein
LGKKYLGACQAIHTSATQRVQRGTNRPSGNRYRKRPNEAEPRKWKNATGTSQTGCRAARVAIVTGRVAVPKVRSARETNSPMRSSDLRQKMSAATAPYTDAKTTSIATE